MRGHVRLILRPLRREPVWRRAWHQLLIRVDHPLRNVPERGAGEGGPTDEHAHDHDGTQQKRPASSPGHPQPQPEPLLSRGRHLVMLDRAQQLDRPQPAGLGADLAGIVDQP